MTGPDFPLILPQGVTGAVIRFSDRLTDAANRAAIAFRAAIADDPPDGVEETSSALASVFLRFDPHRIGYEDLEAGLRRRLAARDFFAAPLPENRRRWSVPAVFGGDHGPALESVAAAAGLSPEDAVRDLTGRPVRVLAIGFAPGMPYLGELPERWDIPRLADLVDVPDGALVLAIRQLVLFTNPSPTGWQQVAQTAFRPFRPENEDPFALRPGDEVAFRPVSAEEFARLDDTPDAGATCEALA